LGDYDRKDSPLEKPVEEAEKIGVPGSPVNFIRRVVTGPGNIPRTAVILDAVRIESGDGLPGLLFLPRPESEKIREAKGKGKK